MRNQQYSNNISYYQASANYTVPVNKIDSNESCDVCVIGGGLVGISAAYTLAKDGYKVILLEADTIANGASGRNGGQILNGFHSSPIELITKYGQDVARQLWDISHLGVCEIKQNIAKHNLQCDWVSGTGIVAYHKSHVKQLYAYYETATKVFNYPYLQLWDQAKTANTILSYKSYYATLYDAATGHMHPLNYVLGMANVLIDKGVKVYQFAKASKVTTTVTVGSAEPSYVIQVNNSNENNQNPVMVMAKKVVLAANLGNSLLFPQLNGRYVSFTSPVAATNKLAPEVVNSLIKNKMAVCDTRWIMDYYRTTCDNRLLFGGGDSFFTIKNIKPVLQQHINSIFPQLASSGGLNLDYIWYGQESMTLNMMPDVGRISAADNIFYAHGFSGHGVALSTAVGKMIADAIAGEDAGFMLLTKAESKPRMLIKYPLLNQAILRLAGLYYNIMDKLG